jgi:ATP-dependent DNA helicase RecG
MPSTQEVLILLDELERVTADSLESQTLDFKEWSRDGMNQAVWAMVEHTVCMANGGGGTLAVGVHDRRIGRANAILGVPANVNAQQLHQSIYDRTEPHISVAIDELPVHEGTGRVLVIQVPGDMRPYTDSRGAAKIRVGRQCEPMTGSVRAGMLAATGATDATREPIGDEIEDLVSAAAMEILRNTAAKSNAPAELLRRNDEDLLRSIGVVAETGQLRRAGLLLVGKPERISDVFPGYRWSFQAMKSSTQYEVNVSGTDSIITALSRIESALSPFNPITTVQQGLLHLEFTRYPTVALREGLLNAFTHADYRLSGVIQMKVFHDRLEISNPGGFIGGVSEDNILRHAPIARNPTLANALIALSLVNRSNLGMPRMYEAMLLDGKEPPAIRDEGNSVRLCLPGGEFSAPFRAFVQATMERGFQLSLEHLLVLNYVSRHAEIALPDAALICQQTERQARESLRALVVEGLLIARQSQGRAYWTFSLPTAHAIHGEAPEHVDRFDAAERDTLAALARAVEGGRRGLTIQEIRDRVGLSVEEGKYLVRRMRRKNLVVSTGKPPRSLWVLAGDS